MKFKESLTVLNPFIKLFRRQIFWIITGTFLSFLTIFASIGLLSLSGWFISATAYASLSFSVAFAFNFFIPASGVRFFSLLRILSRYGERLITHEATFKVLTDIRVWVYTKLEPLAPGHLINYQSGDLLNRMVSDVDALDALYIRIISPTFVLILTSFTIFCFFSFFSFHLAWVLAILILILAFFIPFIISVMAYKTGIKITENEAYIRTSTLTYIQGLTELKIFNKEEEYKEKLINLNKNLISLQRKMANYQAFGAFLMVFFMGLILTWVIFTAISLVNNNALNGANIALLALGTLAMFEAINPLPVAYQYLSKVSKSASRILQITNKKPNIIFKDKTKDNIFSNEEININFKNISFSYLKSNKEIFNNFSYEINNNDKIAIIGETGIGKSSLANLLTRTYDISQGEILINNYDIKDISENDLRENITYLIQKPHLFNTTIRENLKIYSKKATDEEIKEALKIVQLYDFINSLDDKLEHFIGEGGKKLSGGQQKRLAIAGAILRNSKLLILDEPTEGIDKNTEIKLLESLEKNLKDKTVLMITHNPNVLKYCNKVLNLNLIKK